MDLEEEFKKVAKKHADYIEITEYSVIKDGKKKKVTTKKTSEQEDGSEFAGCGCLLIMILMFFAVVIFMIKIIWKLIIW